MKLVKIKLPLTLLKFKMYDLTVCQGREFRIKHLINTRIFIYIVMKFIKYKIWYDIDRKMFQKC